MRASLCERHNGDTMEGCLVMTQPLLNIPVNMPHKSKGTNGNNYFTQSGFNSSFYSVQFCTTYPCNDHHNRLFNTLAN